MRAALGGIGLRIRVGRSWSASTAMPANSEPRMNAVRIRVIAAFRDSGLRNACTPFEIASTPLNATAPDENARINRKNVTPPSIVSPP